MRRSRKPVWAVSSIEGSNPSLSVSRQIRTFLPHGLPEDRPPALAFHAPTSPRLPHGRPIVHPGSGTAWPRSDAPVLRPAHRVIIRSRRRREAPSLLEVSTCGRWLARRRKGVVGAHFPTAAPSSSLCVTYWVVTRNEPVPSTGAQRDTPELPVEVCREGFLRLAEQVGAQLNAQVLTEREMLQEDRPIPARAPLTDTTNHALLPPCGSEEASQHARRRTPPIRPRSAAWLQPHAAGSV